MSFSFQRFVLPNWFWLRGKFATVNLCSLLIVGLIKVSVDTPCIPPQWSLVFEKLIPTNSNWLCRALLERVVWLFLARATAARWAVQFAEFWDIVWQLGFSLQPYSCSCVQGRATPGRTALVHVQFCCTSAQMADDKTPNPVGHHNDFLMASIKIIKTWATEKVVRWELKHLQGSSKICAIISSLIFRTTSTIRQPQKSSQERPNTSHICF